MLNLDPYALEITEDIHEDEDNKSESGARWEHEDLAQVESFILSFSQTHNARSRCRSKL